MELVGLAKELLQSGAEVAVSYRVGQAVLRHADRALWVVEKSARWAVPPAVEPEETTPPPPELVRPLPWPLFLALLVALRTARESVSLLNLLLGKPPLRPADVVMFLQSKRRYLRALKYQGNRNMRARANQPHGAQTSQWLSSFYSLLEMTMCFRRPLEHAGNNNTSLPSNNDDEILVVRKSKKRGDKGTRPSHTSPPPDENTMERLIEKMVDMYGESSDDSEYTLTNATSIKSDTSITSDEEENTEDNTLIDAGDSQVTSSTPNKSGSVAASVPPSDCSQIQDSLLNAAEKKQTDCAEEEDSLLNAHTDSTLARDGEDPLNTQIDSPKKASETLIDSEKRPEETPKKATKLANGRTPKSSPGSKKDSPNLRDSNVPTVKITPADDPNNTNGNVEGAYSQIDCGAAPVQGQGEETVKKTVSSKTTGKSQNKMKESKIKAPLWKKSKN